jgi:hypothetical protein
LSAFAAGGWTWRRRIKLRQRRAQRIEPWRARIPVVFDGATERRDNSGKLFVGELNRRHG